MGSCGFVPFRRSEESSEEELGAFTLMEAGPEHEILIMGTPPDAAADLNISGEIGSRVLVAYLYRHLAYSICWCARNCFKDGVSEVDEEAFSAEIGEFFPRGPETENVPPQKVVAGATGSCNSGTGTGE
ncbi:unnamed protein product [Durusdinium trenchii]|uniref:Uncharacterized protein n=1 Tax=Durusdinium trenchii TaxID=1381693 RepID=A0ABP0NYK8_9DINO